MDLKTSCCPLLGLSPKGTQHIGDPGVDIMLCAEERLTDIRGECTSAETDIGQ